MNKSSPGRNWPGLFCVCDTLHPCLHSALHYGKISVMPDDIIGSTEACTILNIDKATISRWVAAGQITPIGKLPRKNGAFFFDREDIEKLANLRATTA